MFRLLPLALLLGTIGCGPDPLTCAELDRDADAGLTCAPLYIPTFDNAYDNTFAPKCALGGCHAGTHPKGFMDLTDRDGAYDELLEVGQDRVIPGDPECSILVERITTTDSDWHMPPGETLPESERCAIARWVDLGAPR